MPSRIEPFVNNQIYHVFNKTIDGKDLLYDSANPKQFYERLCYYRSIRATRRFTDIPKLGPDSLDEISQEVSNDKHNMVQVLCYCIMPTHYHLMLKQVRDEGIPRYISKVSNSFTRYFNVKNKRKGQLFLKDFKAVLVRSDEQLIHTSRYIHLNPYTSSLVKRFEDLEKYKWSSYSAFIAGKDDKLVENKTILAYFEDNEGRYQEFVRDNADYQRSLGSLKYAGDYTI